MHYLPLATFVSLAFSLGAYAQQSTSTITTSSSLTTTGTSASASSPTVTGNATSCTALATKVSTLIPDYPVNSVVSEVLPAGSTFNQSTGGMSQPVTDLPELCRFAASFNTSSNSSVKFEVWIPTTTWNGRFAFVGNGGAGGFINYGSMGGAVSNYGFAAASTNTGHDGNISDGSFAAGNPNSQIDFGFRAVHLSTVFAKNAVKEFYGSQASTFKSYWIGCSGGGQQGLKEVQTYPDDFDGALVGSPAWWYSHLSAWSLRDGILNPSGDGHISSSDFLTLHQAILSQCDSLDGLTDGIITNPAACNINWTATGLSAAQQQQAIAFYTNWTNSAGELLFPAYYPGAEEGGMLAGTDGSTGPFWADYFKYQILNYTSVAAASNVTFNDTNQLAQLVSIADQTNPGGFDANNYNISTFFNNGGKLIHYVGTQDPAISYGMSLYYHERVHQTLGDVSDSYRLFPVSGMAHCGGGTKSPNNFGSDPGMSGSKPNNTSPSNNAILALIQWVEANTAPNQIIGTGTNFSRPLCPYPKFATYISGNDSDASSFVCQ